MNSIQALLTPEIMQAAITIVTPVIIAGVKALVPRIKPVYLPIAAPIVGFLLSVVANFAGAPEVHPALALGLGLAGVGLREAADQLKKAVPASPPGS